MAISANQIVSKRERCGHCVEFDEQVYYKRCKGCGQFHPFRNPADIDRRGAMPEMGDPPPVDDSNDDEINGLDQF